MLANSLFSNMFPSSSANDDLTKIFNTISDQYITSAASNEKTMEDLSGFYTEQGTSLLSSLGFPQNSTTDQLIAAIQNSQQQPAFSLDSLVNGTNKSDLIQAVNLSIMETEINLFSNQFPSTGGLLDILS